jgi:hypothetical protein
MSASPLAEKTQTGIMENNGLGHNTQHEEQANGFESTELIPIATSLWLRQPSGFGFGSRSRTSA